jgi:hypothetical protein
MARSCKAMLVAVTIAIFGLMSVADRNPALANKAKPGKPHHHLIEAVKKYEHALDTAMRKLKEAERALSMADIKELNLRNTSPLAVQRLTAAIQAVNQAYAWTGEARAAAP